MQNQRLLTFGNFQKALGIPVTTGFLADNAIQPHAVARTAKLYLEQDVAKAARLIAEILQPKKIVGVCDSLIFNPEKKRDSGFQSVAPGRPHRAKVTRETRDYVGMAIHKNHGRSSSLCITIRNQVAKKAGLKAGDYVEVQFNKSVTPSLCRIVRTKQPGFTLYAKQKNSALILKLACSSRVPKFDSLTKHTGLDVVDGQITFAMIGSSFDKKHKTDGCGA